MRYFELTDDVNVPSRWYLGEVTCTDGTKPRLRVGLAFLGSGLNSGVYRDGDPVPFSLSSFAVPVARTGLAAAIQSIVDGDVQRLAVTIPGQEGFEVLNVVRVVKCLDEGRSEFRKWSAQDHRSDLAGQYRMVTRLRILADAIPGDAHAFRIDGWLIALIVSERVKVAMEAFGCVGAKFSEVT